MVFNLHIFLFSTLPLLQIYRRSADGQKNVGLARASLEACDSIHFAPEQGLRFPQYPTRFPFF